MPVFSAPCISVTTVPAPRFTRPIGPFTSASRPRIVPTVASSARSATGVVPALPNVTFPISADS